MFAPPGGQREAKQEALYASASLSHCAASVRTSPSPSVSPWGVPYPFLEVQVAFPMLQGVKQGLDGGRCVGLRPVRTSEDVDETPNDTPPIKQAIHRSPST
jgi:hypothetical protein